MLNLLMQRIPKRTLLFYTLALILLVLGNLLWQNYHPILTPVTNSSNQHQPDYYIMNASSHSYDRTGKKTNEMASDYLEHIHYLKTTQLSSPTFIFLPKTTQQKNQQWIVSADTGTIYESALPTHSGVENTPLLWLQGNVLLHNNQHNKSNLQEKANTFEDAFALSTQSLQLFYTQDTLRSEAPVTIQQGKNVMSAKGMVFNLNTNQLNFQSSFTGQIFPRNP